MSEVFGQNKKFRIAGRWPRYINSSRAGVSSNIFVASIFWQVTELL
jgi:hypothetical protein